MRSTSFLTESLSPVNSYASLCLPGERGLTLSIFLQWKQVLFNCSSTHLHKLGIFYLRRKEGV